MRATPGVWVSGVWAGQTQAENTQNGSAAALECAAMPQRPEYLHPEQLLLFDEAPVLTAPGAIANPAAKPAATPAALFAAPAVPTARPTPQGAGHAAETPVLAQPSPAAPTGATAPQPATEFRHPRSQREALLAGHRVAYELRRSRRHSIGFVVGAEGLSVSAPRWVGQTEIEAALREKASWILRKLQEQRERGARLQAARVQWAEGGSVPFLGETVIMVLDPRGHHHPGGAVLHTDAQSLPGVPRLTLHLGLPQTAEPDQIRDMVQSWLQRQARRVFEERCTEFAQRLGVQVKRLSLSSASTRWGSASADGSVRLNWRLVHFGLPVIDYVVTHELAHLREMNHSAAFWNVVRSALPGFEAARGALKREVLPVLE